MQRVLTCGFTAQFSIIIEAITAESNGITHYKKKGDKTHLPSRIGFVWPQSMQRTSFWTAK